MKQNKFFEIKDGEIINGNLSQLKNGKYKATELGGWITLLQHHYYRGWVLPWIRKGLEELGYYYSNEQIHNDLKDILLSKREYNELTGTWSNRVKSMGTMNKKETIEYIKDVQSYVFNNFNIVIPEHEHFKY